MLPSRQFFLMLLVQMSLALRISEVVKIKVSDIDPYRRTIAIFEPKTQKAIEKPIPLRVFEHLLMYLKENKGKFQHYKDYLWFSDGSPSKKHAEPHLTKDYARKVFKETIKKARMDRIYAVSRDGKPLYILSTHSLRRTGINKILSAVGGDPFLGKDYSGHDKIQSLEIYAEQRKKEEIKRIVDEVF